MHEQTVTAEGRGWRAWRWGAGEAPPAACGQWDDRLAFGDGDPTQTLAWAEYALRTDYQEAVALAQGEAALALGLVWTSHLLPGVFRGMRFPAYPLGGEALSLVAACEAEARRRGCLRVEFCGAGQPDAVAALRPKGYRVRADIEYVLDLSVGVEALRARMRADQRRNVKVSRTRGVVVTRADTREAVQALRALQLQVAARRGARGESVSIRGAHRYEVLYETLVARGLVRLYLAHLAGEVIAAAAVLHFGRRARLVHSGTSPAGLTARAPTAVLWRAMEELAEEGGALFSLGTEAPGAQDPHSAAHGLHLFKVGLGARVREVTTITKELRPARARVYEAVRRVRGK